jgi:hypothetical protein
MRVRALVIVLAFGHGACLAETWDQITTSSEAVFYIEKDSHRPFGKYMKAWVHVGYHEGQKHAYGGEYRGVRELVYANCAERTLATKQRAFYSDNFGATAPVSSQTFQDIELTFEEPIPGSVGVAVINRVCARR